MRITLRQLMIFKAICTERQISKAAKLMHMSTPAVSMALKELENSLGCRLFERAGGGLELNAHGKIILPYANEMLSKGNELEKLFNFAEDGVKGCLVIGSSKTVGNYVLSRKIPLFKDKYPDVKIKLIIENSLVIEKMVSEKEIDLGFIDAKPASRNLICEQWMQDKLCIVSGCSHPVAKQECSSHILSEQLWVFDHESSLSHIRAVQLLKSLNVYVRNDICMSTIGAIKRAIGTGIGLSVLPYVAIKEELERGELCLIDLKGWDYKRTYWSIQRESDELSLQSNIFLNFLNNAS
ncbi:MULTISPECIES: LysR family transcriptional regulator [Shewanella]|uniref:LysR family transcriptional regulator n=1 Tax=Shewanella TaxID=22 RepID=UPI000C129B30|nr:MULTISPECIES: LysR family transcriptional regulator [Shewanella]PZP33689.1 MAG: LysR family transcriptional regulator [Shewanella oneidensis]MCT8864698.1 LysR family transcriptional regulator [Shewanella xiamenensis]MCT8877149.1 LysR family transcriptional regulator [Shewanella xiamenensis]MDH1315639.1 LysR family transcriptional regulator [Shewanella xiamenensis]NMD50934.1 LysR family transcriptional regulator [Shewanella sp. DNRA4]